MRPPDSATYVWVLVFMHTRFMVNRTFSDMLTERLHQRILENTKMVIYSTVQSRCYIININNTGIGVQRIFSIDRQSRHFACPFQAADDTMQMRVHITLYPFCTTKKITHVTATVPKIRFVGSKVSFTLHKSMWLTAISSHCLAALPARDVFNSHMRLNAYCRNLKRTFVAMLLLRNEGQFQNYPHPSFATCLCSQCSGHEWTASSKLHDTTTVNPALAQCVVSENKTVAERIKSIKLLTSSFLDIFGS